MRKLILFSALLINCYSSFSQYNSRPSRSRFYNSKLSTFVIAPGDILLYSVSKDSQQYEIVVTVKKYGNTISFDYSMPEKAQAGNVFIQAAAVKNAVKYDTLLTGSVKNFKDSSVLWLSQKNYTDLASAKETTMDFGNGKESFKRLRVSTMKLNYKGKERIVTVFGIESTSSSFKKELLVLSEEANPLIVSMNAGWSLSLKEIR